MRDDQLRSVMLAYRRGELSQAEAAAQLKMRKEDFAQRATDWAMAVLEGARDEIERVRQDVLWRAYLRRFMATFPECDARCYQRDKQQPKLRKDSLWRPHLPTPVRTYKVREAARLAPAQSGTGTGKAWDNRGIGWERVPLGFERLKPAQDDDPEAEAEAEAA